MFRGREMAHTEIGQELLMRVKNGFGDKINMEQPPRLEGRNMSMIISPKANAWPKKQKTGADNASTAKDKSTKDKGPATERSDSTASPAEASDQKAENNAEA